MATRTRTAFDLAAELPKAWDWCWSYYCEETRWEEDEYDADGLPTGKKTGEVRVSPPRQSWLTATDLERRLRARAVEIMDGREYGTGGQDGWGSRIRISGLNGYSLLDTVRNWLRRNLKLESHNFGKGHISGERYRPVGSGLTESEQETVEKKRKRAAGETPVHFRFGENFFTSKCLCAANRNVKRASYRTPKGSKSRMTSKPEEVTCPRCKKLLAEKSATVPA